MPKLFLIALGGTGSRVVKSLVHLMAAGVRPDTAEAWTIVPMILDPHEANKDLIRTTEQITRYAQLHRASHDTGDSVDKLDWFSNDLKVLGDLQPDAGLSDTAVAKLRGIGHKKFGEFVGLGSLSNTRRTLVHAMYSQDQLDVSMDIGFVGNPSIGVVALEHLERHDELKAMGNSWKEGDRIFIVSSIFGGTGAAAFPILLKVLRDPQSLPSSTLIKDASIGALSVQPYFRVAEDEHSRVKQSEFFGRTKEALHYYSHTIEGELNGFYSLGDQSNAAIHNDPGEGGQRNDAHFAEVVGALAVLDFLERVPPSRSDNKQYEFAIKKDGTVNFDNLDDGTTTKLYRPLLKFFLFARYVRGRLPEDLSGSRKGRTYLKDFPEGFRHDLKLRTLQEFVEEWWSWLTELAGNDRAFRPLYPGQVLAKAIDGVEPKKKLFGRKSLDLDDLSGAFNDAYAKHGNSKSVAQLLRDMEAGTTTSIDNVYERTE